MPLLFILMAGFFIVIALKTLIYRCPIVISTRWFFVFMCLSFLPMLIRPFVGFPAGNMSMEMWLIPVMYIVLLVFFWIQMKGFIVIAVTEDYFRDALLAAASSFGYTVEETMSRMRIKETGHDIQVSIQGWVGVAQLKSSGYGSGEILSKLVIGMNQHFKNSSGKINYITSYFYLIIGVLLIVASVWFFTLSM